jgi:hypothetical protein
VTDMFVCSLDEICKHVFLVDDVSSQLVNTWGGNSVHGWSMSGTECKIDWPVRKGKGHVSILIPADIGDGEVLGVPAGVPGGSDEIDSCGIIARCGRVVLTDKIASENSGSKKESK